MKNALKDKSYPLQKTYFGAFLTLVLKIALIYWVFPIPHWCTKAPSHCTITVHGTHQVVRSAPIRANFGELFVGGTLIQLFSPLEEGVSLTVSKGLCIQQVPRLAKKTPNFSFLMIFKPCKMIPTICVHSLKISYFP